MYQTILCVLILILLTEYADLHTMNPLIAVRSEILSNRTIVEPISSSVSGFIGRPIEELDESIIIQKLYQLDILCDKLSYSAIKRLSHLCTSSDAVLAAIDYSMLYAAKGSLTEIFEQDFAFQNLSRDQCQIIRADKLSDQQQLVLYPCFKLLLDSKKNKKLDRKTSISSSMLQQAFLKPKKPQRLNEDDEQVLQLYESLKQKNQASKTFRTHAQKVFDKFVRSYQPYRRLRVKIHQRQNNASSSRELDVSVLSSCNELRDKVLQRLEQATQSAPLTMTLHVRGRLETLPAAPSTLSLLSFGCVPPGFILHVS
jgi:hypothetical protein